MNPYAVYVRAPAGRREPLACGHCDATHTDPVAYVGHVRECLSDQIALWDPESYSARYYEQVRAISRFRGVGPRRRSPFRAWNWYAVKPDGPALTPAEVAG